MVSLPEAPHSITGVSREEISGFNTWQRTDILHSPEQSWTPESSLRGTHWIPLRIVERAPPPSHPIRSIRPWDRKGPDSTLSSPLPSKPEKPHTKPGPFCSVDTAAKQWGWAWRAGRVEEWPWLWPRMNPTWDLPQVSVGQVGFTSRAGCPYLWVTGLWVTFPLSHLYFLKECVVLLYVENPQ